MKTIHLTLSQLSCGHCVVNVKKQLLALEGVESAEVSLTEATIVTDLSAEILIQTIVNAGYEATIADQK